MTIHFIFEVVGGTTFVVFATSSLAPAIVSHCLQLGHPEEVCRSHFLYVYQVVTLVTALVSLILTSGFHCCCAVGSFQRVWRDGGMCV